MQFKKFLVSIVVIIIAFVIGYGDAIGLIQSHTGNLFTKITSYFSTAKQSAIEPSALDEKQPSPPPSAGSKVAKETKTSPVGLNNLQGQIPGGQEKKRSKYLDDLRERLKESQEEPSDENDQGQMDTDESAEVPNDEPEELPPAFTDPYAQFRRPPGSPGPDQPSSFVTDNESEESVEEDNSVEEVSPAVDEVDEAPTEDQNDN